MAAGKLDVLDTLEGRKAVQAMATYLGIDATNEKQLMWIAERALMAPLPRNWEEISTPDGKVRCRWAGNVSARAASFARARSSHLRLPSDVLHAQRVEDHVVAAPPRRVLQVARPAQSRTRQVHRSRPAQQQHVRGALPPVQCCNILRMYASSNGLENVPDSIGKLTTPNITTLNP